MREKCFLLLSAVLFLIEGPSGYSQIPQAGIGSERRITDTLSRELTQGHEAGMPAISFTRNQAVVFLERIGQPGLWKKPDDPFRSALGQLVFEAILPPFDSAEYALRSYPYDSLAVHGFRILKDTTVMTLADTLGEASLNDQDFPFRYFRFPYQADSIKAAVDVLLGYLEKRDSSIIYLSDAEGRKYPLRFNSHSGNIMRFWLKNDMNDSVSVWVGNPERNTIGLFLENGVSIRRPMRQGYYSEAGINVEKQDRTTLIGINKIKTKTQFWDFRTEASFALNQGMLSNWVKGGESSIASALDVTWFANYLNKPMLLSSSHFVRLKYGMIATGGENLRTNLDLLETNSKFNHKAFGKFDFSAIMLFKTQISRGYNYPNDTVPVSRFMNPAILTLGIGLDYKPNRTTSINFSPLSYKATFVPDTSLIDQTKYGIPDNRKSMHEPGASFLVSNEFRPVKNLLVTNRLQFFTNYINKPQNVDVDWEMILLANLNWFTDVRLNTHLIYDDDTRTPVFDKEKNPVTDDDGIQKKTARMQFKELLGLSFIFRF
ncbi:MAG: DUF3078 domain-containing protein [Bacteroidales bacterium]